MTKPTKPDEFVRVKNGTAQVYGGYFWHVLSGRLVDEKFVKAAIRAAVEVAIEAERKDVYNMEHGIAEEREKDDV